jgi:prophage antirepressor-like protein
MKELIKLKFPLAGKPIRMVNKNGNPHWVAKDLCEALEINNHRQALTRCTSIEKDTVILNDAIGRSREIAVVNEFGLYRLVITSRSKNVEPFKLWLITEVLPSIRRTGSYSMGSVKPTPSDGMASINRMPSRQVMDMRKQIVQIINVGNIAIREVETEGNKFQSLKDLIKASGRNTPPYRMRKTLEKAGFETKLIHLFGSSPTWYVPEYAGKVVYNSRLHRPESRQLSLPMA